MINWLKNYKGEQAAMENNSEKVELNELRKEMKKLKKRYDYKIKGEEDKEGRVESESEPEEEEDQVEELIEQKKTIIIKKGPRTSVSAEVYGMFNEKKAFEAKVVPKSEDQIQRIQTKVLKSFIFNSLDERDLKTVVDAMEEFTCQENDEVIKQGDPGSVLYIIEKGTFDCYKQFVSTIIIFFV